MHAVIKHLNKNNKQSPICKTCLINAINKSKDETDTDICVSISRTQTLEHDTIERLHRITSIIEESNNLIN